MTIQPIRQPYQARDPEIERPSRHGRRQIRFRTWVKVIVPLLAVVVAFGPTLRYTSIEAAAQAAKMRVSLDVQGCIPTVDGYSVVSDRNSIMQDCALLDAGFDELQQQAIQNVMELHQLPESDRDRVMNWERHTVRAKIFDLLAGIIERPASDRSETEQEIYDKFAERVQQHRLKAAEYSYGQYATWVADPCAYTPPEGFTYQADPALCEGLLPWGFGPRPPSLEEFVKYGEGYTYQEFRDGGAAHQTAGLSARAIAQIAGFSAVGVAGVTGAIIGASLPAAEGIMFALHPFLWSAIAKSSDIGVTARLATIPLGYLAGTSGAFVIGMMFAFIVLAITMAVVAGIPVFEDAAIPGQLLHQISEAQAGPPDLQPLLSTLEGRSELFAALMLATLPEFSSTEPVPSDPNGQFYVDGPSIDAEITDTLAFECWNITVCTSSMSSSVTLHDGWFIQHGVIGGEPQLTLSIDYINWYDEAFTATRVGNKFLITRSGDPERAMLVDEFGYMAPDGSARIARIYQPLMATVTSGTPQEGSPVTFNLSGTFADAPIWTYNWYFGDGAEVLGTEPERLPTQTHTYADNGTYSVVVVGKSEDRSMPGDAADGLISVEVEVNVANVAPTITSFSGLPDSSPEGTAITLSASTSDPGVHDSVTLTWEVYRTSEVLSGPTPGPLVASGTGETFTFTPDDGGDFGISYYDINAGVYRIRNYEVRVTATDDDGATDISSDTMHVTNLAPEGAFNLPDAIDEGSENLLSATSSDPGIADTITHAWSVTKNGAAFSSGAGPSFTFAPDDNGDYEVRLTVTDDEGASGTSTHSVTVTNLAPLVTQELRTADGQLHAAPVIVVQGAKVTITEQYSDPGPLDSRTAVRDWGDGTVEQLGAVTETTTGNHVYTRAGIYTLRSTVTDNDGGQGVATQRVRVVTAAGALEATIDELRVEAASHPAAGMPLQLALVSLDGSSNGRGNDGAIDLFQRGQYYLAIVKMIQAMSFLSLAEAADPSVDLTEQKSLLALTASSVTVDAIAAAQRAADADRKISAQERNHLNRATTARQSGDDRFAAGDYAGALGQYLAAVTAAKIISGQ